MSSALSTSAISGTGLLDGPSSDLLEVPKLPREGWLRTVRRAQGLSQREAAARAGVTQQAFDQFEAGEVRASITLDRLQRAAEALDYEMVYFLRPRTDSRRSRRRIEASSGQQGFDDELPVDLL